MSRECTCGRIGEHCPNAGCGSINKHPLVQRSQIVSAQVGSDVRFYRCRKCGTEYGFLNGNLFDTECNAPSEVRLKPRQIEPEDEVKLLKDAISLLESKGLKVYMPGDEPKSNDTEELVIQKAEPRPSALSLDDLFKKKEPPKDENNS
jgi:hypothetical protein